MGDKSRQPRSKKPAAIRVEAFAGPAASGCAGTPIGCGTHLWGRGHMVCVRCCEALTLFSVIQALHWSLAGLLMLQD